MYQKQQLNFISAKAIQQNRHARKQAGEQATAESSKLEPVRATATAAAAARPPSALTSFFVVRVHVYMAYSIPKPKTAKL